MASSVNAIANTIINSQHQSPLGKIPAETRLNIFEQVFTAPNTSYGSTILILEDPSSAVLLATTDGTARVRLTNPDTVLSLLETCRLFRKECEPIFYQVNSIEIKLRDMNAMNAARFRDFASNMWAWAEELSELRWQAVRSMTIKIEYVYQGDEAVLFMRSVPNLQNSTVAMRDVDAMSMVNHELTNAAEYWGMMSATKTPGFADVGQWSFFHEIRELKLAKPSLNIRAVEVRGAPGNGLRALAAAIAAV